MIPMYSGTFGYIQMNPWSIHLCLLFKKNDKWKYFIRNEFLAPPPWRLRRLVLAGYVPLASQNKYPFIVYSVAISKTQS